MVVRIAIFDLDRTLTSFATFTPFLLGTRKPLFAKAMLMARLLPHMVAHKVGLISRRALKDTMMNIALGRFSRQEISEMSAAFVERTLASGMRAKSLEAIERHKSEGDRLILATASVDFYAIRFAAQLGFDLCVSTATNFSDNSSEPLRLVGANCYGPDKARMVVEALRAGFEESRTGQHWTVYSDHHTDLHLFEVADAAIVVSPAGKTRREAAKRNFPVVEW